MEETLIDAEILERWAENLKRIGARLEEEDPDDKDGASMMWTSAHLMIEKARTLRTTSDLKPSKPLPS